MGLVGMLVVSQPGSTFIPARHGKGLSDRYNTKIATRMYVFQGTGSVGLAGAGKAEETAFNQRKVMGSRNPCAGGQM